MAQVCTTGSQVRESQEQNNQPALLVLNVREEKLPDGRTEWQGEVLDVYGNTVHKFEDWPELVELIAGALDNLPATRRSLPYQNVGSLEDRLLGFQ